MLVSFVHQLDNNRLSIGYVSISDMIVANNDIKSSKHEEISSSQSQDNRITLSIKRNSYRLFFPRLISHVLLTKEQRRISARFVHFPLFHEKIVQNPMGKLSRLK